MLAAAAVSLGNATFLKLWSKLLDPSGVEAYFREAPPTGLEIASAWVCCAAASIVFFCVLWVAARSRSTVARRGSKLLLLILILPAANGLRTVVADGVPALRGLLRFVTLPSLDRVWQLAACGVAAGILWILWRWRVQLFRRLVGIASVGAVFAAMTFAYSLLVLARPKTTAVKPSAVHAQAARNPALRVVVLVWDEWDYRLTFEARPNDLALPHLDRLMQHSLSARQAYPPTDNTLTSLPSLTTGVLIREAETVGNDGLVLYPNGRGSKLHWNSAPSLFKAAHDSGFRVGVTGYYHPYCRVFSDTAADCAWWPMFLAGVGSNRPFPSIVMDQLQGTVESAAMSPFGTSLAARNHALVQQVSIRETVRMAGDRSLGLIFAHLPVPHPPYVYDRATGTYGRQEPRPQGYWNALALLDRSLGEILSAVRPPGATGDTAIILTSDHFLRTAKALDGREDTRIPFIVTLPEGDGAVTYTNPFQSHLLPGLVQALLTGQVRDYQGIARFLDAQRRPVSVLRGSGLRLTSSVPVLRISLF